jgi:hypothetical protein
MLLTRHWASHLGGVSNWGAAAGLSGLALQLLGAMEIARRRQPRTPAYLRETKRALQKDANKKT